MKSDETTFHDACILNVRVETNVPQGGDAGHGGATKLTLTDAGSFAFGGPGVPRSGETVEVEVLGDAEGEVLANALIWAGERLHAMIGTERALPE